jgi:hypothetical protein
MAVLIIMAMISFTNAAPDSLDSWFAGYNHAYFQDELPKTTVITKDLTDDRFMALTFYENGAYHIALNPKYNFSTKIERENLLHESCHILIFIEHEEEFDDHGPKWQHCMHRLADQGAFEDLW